MNKSRFSARHYWGGVSLIALLHVPPAFAQPVTGASPPGTEEAAAGQGLADIVVTAQKRAERLQDVPVAVAAVSSETLTRAGIDSTAALISIVPGLNISSNAAGFRPFLRGVGTSTSAAGNENSVSTYIDNVYLTSMNAGLLNLASIEAIEVLKGPQGTLFGRNATGGVIHIRTRAPSHDFGGNVSLSIDNYETLTGTAYVTGGLSDTVAADFAVYFSDQGQGYGRNQVTGTEVYKDDTITLRSKILFEPSDEDSFTLAVDYSKTDSSGQTYTPYPGTSVGFGPAAPGFPAPQGAPYVYSGSRWDIAHGTDPFLKNWAGGISLTYVRDMSWATLSSFTAYRKSRVRQVWNATPEPSNAQLAGWTQPEEQFSQELQLNSPAGDPVKWIVGLYYLDANVRYDPFFIAGNVIAPNRQEFRMKQRIQSPAIYGQFTVPVDALSDTNITGGLRYTIDKRSLDGRVDIYSQVTDQFVSNAYVTDESKTFKTFTWRLSADHKFTPDMMAYISYNRGFKAGAYNTIPPSRPGVPPSNPEFLDAYEIGLKNTLFGGDATLNLSAFLYKYRDLQVTIFNQATATIENAGAEIKGLDIDFKYQATRDLQINLSAEILDHKFKNYQNAPILAINPVSQGGGVTRTSGDASGNRLPYTSDFTLNAGIFYTVPTNFGEIDLNVNAIYNDGFTFEPSELVRQGSFVDINATAGLTLPNETTRISAFVRNAANEAIPRVVATGTNPGGYVEAQYRPPRTYGISVSQKF